jgi:hypothetical protein
MGKVYVTDVGVTIRLDVDVDISAATLTRYDVEKPDGTTTTWTTSAYDSTTMTYTTVDADFKDTHSNLLPGIYLIHAYAEWGSVSKHLGETFALEVTPKYD